jgi:hypothetical protein
MNAQGLFAVFHYLLLRSTDDGLMFRDLGGLLPCERANALESAGSDLILGCERGLFRSGDGGRSWASLAESTVRGEVLSLLSDGSRLFVGTRTSGVQVVDLEPVVRRLLPIVLDVDTGSARYRTELALTNRGAGTAAITYRYTASLGGRQGSGTVTDTLAAGRQIIIPDAIDYLRQRGLAIPPSRPGDSQGGTLLVTFSGLSDPDVVSVLARTGSATQAPQPAGWAGLAYPGLSPSEGSTGTVTILGLRQNATDRSNVAVFSVSDEPVHVRMKAFSGDGTGRSQVVADDIALPPYGWYQVSGALGPAGISTGWVTLERTSATGSFSAYGVINDNATNDGSFVAPVVERATMLRNLTVPVIVETSVFASELVLTNRSAKAATLSLAYTESLSPLLSAGGRATVTLAGYEQRIIPGAIDFLRKNGVALAPSGSGGFAGTLRIEVEGPPISEVFAGARTAAASPSGGEFGLFTAPIYPGEEGFSGTVVLPGLRRDDASRTNIAVANVGGTSEGAATIQLSVVGSGGGPRITTSITLGPGQWKQLPLSQFAGVSNGWAEVSRTDGSAPWIAYAVVNDGNDSGGPGTGDGAYVPMIRPAAP